MTATDLTAPSVEVMWRPGCPYCSSLRRGLRRAGVVTTEHDIWSSVAAAARVREATGGDETVPTVVVGGRALVNPSARQVLDAIRVVDPDYQPDATRASGRARGTQAVVSAGLLATVVVALLWSALALWRPGTTWHLAPFILAAAWAGVGGLGAAAAVTGVLYEAGRLQGPTVTGAGTAVAEALILSVVGAAIATATGLRRVARGATAADQDQLV